ncbi:MAG: heat-shock protein [Mariprofundaceae bacterium]
MTTLLMSLIAAALLVIAAIYWRQIQDEEDSDGQQEDGRVIPLLRGINYLLSDEPDLALQEMVQVARLRSEAADVYMALGEMFRAKGEIGRAVRIHQNILARPDVPKALHLQAHLALGKDFQTGGLLDRALLQYEKALMIQSDHKDALEVSLRIREQSHEWVEAEGLLSRLEQVQGSSLHLHRAYLFAEMADLGFSKNIENAQTSAERALKLDAACAHAYVVLTKIHLQHDDFSSAEKILQKMRKETAEHLHLLIPVTLKNRKFYQKHAQKILMEYWNSSKDEELALSWLEAVAAKEGVGQVHQLKQQLDFSASTLRASLRLAAIESDVESPLSAHAAKWRKKMKHFLCNECGMKVVELRWQCPQCHAWGTMHAIREEDL